LSSLFNRYANHYKAWYERQSIVPLHRLRSWTNRNRNPYRRR
jgi:hypothetical protein